MSNKLASYGVALTLLGAAAGVGGVAVQQMMNTAAAPSALAAPAATTSAADAVRLAKQATFGPNQAVVDRIQQIGAAAWVDEQLALNTSTYSDMATAAYAQKSCSTELCIATYYRAQPVIMRFYSNALSKDDQLRQRVAFALSQLIVTSGLKVEYTAGVASFQEILLKNAFGNYKDILKQVTLNPAMGNYLDMAGSVRSSPNQNYARELMQIFSIYPSKLTAGGEIITDASGASLPTYSELDVDEVARALTGWTYARYGGTKLPFDERLPDYSKPMQQFPASYDAFDKGAKTILGATIPAGATPEQNVDGVINAIFAQPNVGPYVSKHLIQHLVTSNPSPAYVARVSAVFDNNGSGVKGDLKAVVRAILLDDEARGEVKTDPDYGKLKEPALYITSFLRLMNATSDGFFGRSAGIKLNQSVFEAPSVFNFYPGDFPLARSNQHGSGKLLVSPSTKLTGAGLDHERHTFAFYYTILDEYEGTGKDYKKNTDLGSKTGTKVDWKQWETLGSNDAGINKMIDKMNLLMLNNTMTAAQRTALFNAMKEVDDGSGAALARARAKTGLYIVLSSPQFQVDR